ncbi:methionine biosynthesis protein MetW [Propioniciclava sinopodophylli]|uniref:Methionine biosynthesis protein MetW n=1 Tax=Propioniciclava sinopodophylli TaxID=1837344 RepID=A0A4Q9KFR1_9ACTN|nr:methionine biosynthesis protein MetW [Propioniciclava sinopodophylli]TBT85403.1 methionine biosynthesis protein MetW [Propioniciclava sinopodophylli]
MINAAGLRLDLELIAGQVFPGSRVLDLGCGTGTLLAHLMATKGCSATGVEIDPDKVVGAIRKGVPVLERDVEEALVDIDDESYDVVVLSRTLQTMLRPEFVLSQMGRVAERMVVSVPNFGYLPNRVRLMNGRMPVSKELPYAWYNTPNLRFTTLVDLEDLFARLDLVVDRRYTYSQAGRRLRMYGRLPNLMAGAAVYVLRPAR